MVMSIFSIGEDCASLIASFLDVHSSVTCLSVSKSLRRVITIKRSHEHLQITFNGVTTACVLQCLSQFPFIKVHATMHDLVDVSDLGGLTTLNMSGCAGVTDVSALGGLTTLNMNRCAGVTDVSALGGLTTLYMSRCTGVTDVSALGGLTTLNMSGCTGVTDVSALRGLRRYYF
jgi:hypothetical protein